jgi:hypothetical protein
MGQLDKSTAFALRTSQQWLLPPEMWLHLHGLSHDMSLMPYEQAEIEEYSLELEDALHGAGGAFDKSAASRMWRS